MDSLLAFNSITTGSCENLRRCIFACLNKLEIDLAPKRVNARDFDADVVAQAELAAVAAAFDDVFLLVVVVVVVGEESRWIGW